MLGDNLKGLMQCMVPKQGVSACLFADNVVTQFVGQTESRDNLRGDIGDAFNVVGRTGCEIFSSKQDVLCEAPDQGAGGL